MQSITPPITLAMVTRWRVAGFTSERDLPLARGQLTVQLLGADDPPEDSIFEAYLLDIGNGPNLTQTLSRSAQGRFKARIALNEILIAGALDTLVAAERAVTTGRVDELAALEAACVALSIVDL